MKVFKTQVYFILMVLVMVGSAFAFVVPEEDSKAKYFYVFGPDGDPDLGAEGAEQSLYIAVPKDCGEEVYISVYDPDTGGRKDMRAGFKKPWDTVTEFSVYGSANTLLGKKTFGESAEYDSRYCEFGPFSASRGEDKGGFYRFRVTAKAIEGTDENIYKIKILPDCSQAYSYNITFRLLEKEGSKMYFYPEIPANTRSIVVRNYDMDPNGGKNSLYDPYSRKWHRIKDSQSSQWAETPLDIAEAPQARRLEYVITKVTQIHANAGIMILDENGNALPIYFKDRQPLAPEQEPVIPEPSPEPKCNSIFLFDATKSFDPQDRQLTYLWDFGDGNTSTEPVIKHEYAQAGTYTVKLTVRNDSGLECDTSEITDVVRVNSAPNVAFIGPELVCPGQEIEFDAGATTDATSKNLTYSWDFGDGAKVEGINVKKTYKNSGVYKVVLTVNDNESTSCSVASKAMHVRVNTLPVADAGSDIDMCIKPGQEYLVKLSAQNSGSFDESKVTYLWELGDGAIEQGRNVSHIYEKGGKYQARLVVDDGTGLACSTSSDVLSIELSRQPVAVAKADKTACVGSDVMFDASGSSGDEGCDLAYAWDFGDGSAKKNGKAVTHAYEKGGKYKVALTVNNLKGKECSVATDTLSIRVNTHPTARLKDAAAACVYKDVEFDASGSNDPDGDILKYVWDFGDGTIGEGPAKVKHQYSEGGVYKVAVLVDDGQETVCSKDTAEIKVRVNRPPKALAGTNLVCCINKTSNFDASLSIDPDNDKLVYVWDFGDGGLARGEKVSHKFTKPGKYRVTLTVKDDSGTACDTATDFFEAVVSEKPVSVIRIEGK